MNGEAFKRLGKLQRVDLRENQCLKEDFRDVKRIKALPQVVTEKCGFCDINAQCEKLKRLEEMISEINLKLDAQTNFQKELQLRDAELKKLKEKMEAFDEHW